uniref:NADH-ubiquinone oxidoreductase chain 6 n=1 Tax=Docosaccus maculatus TaxID=1503681 RepID=A0A0K0KN80_9METZ|nr:NADH dehydrogenase subunit 6 [Docosaccus maculatus]
MIFLLCINITITRLIITTTTRRIFRAIWLIITFINAALILIILEIEFIAILIIIVYIGAIAILFLFTIMMLNLNTKIKKEEETHLIPLRIIIIILIIKRLERRNNKRIIEITNNNNNNIETISKLLYSEYRPWFLIRRIILLIRMIATITIIQKEEYTRIKQQLFTQLQRKIHNK